MKKVRNILLAAAALFLVMLVGYIVYLFAAYYRLEDSLPLAVENSDALPQTSAGESYNLVSYNLGFGAYTPDYSFFMDGGRESRTRSAENAIRNITGAAENVLELEPDFIFFQEVDIDSTRSYHVDQLALLREILPKYGAVFAQNYDSPYLFWPPVEPHGASKSGLVTFSAFQIDCALRRSLPIETGISKFMDLDRCYSVSRLPVDNGKTLCLYNAHLSAYTTNGNTAVNQLNMLLEDMSQEYEAGNYVICGGDFNRDLLGDSSLVFGHSGDGENWAKPFPTEVLPEHISLPSSLDEEHPVPSCRDTGDVYDPDSTFVLTVDGFLVSDNVSVNETRVVDNGFTWSDHQPVLMNFTLK